MPFLLNPMFLMALGAAAIPVALHLLHRRNPKPVMFSTLRFLQEAIAKTRRSRHVTQLLVLLLRMLVIALLAFAFAQPRIKASGWLPEGPRTVILVLDASVSMQLRDGGQTLFDKSKEWALALLDSLRDRDRVALVLPGLEQPRVAFPATSNHGRIRRLLEQAECSQGTVNLAAALKSLAGDMEERSGESRELHVFSDFQASTWRPRDAKELAATLFKADLRLFLNHIRAKGVGNAWIANLRLFPEAILGSADVLARATVRTDENYQGANLVHLYLDGAERSQKGISLSPETELDCTLAAPVTASGDFAAGSVSLDSDALAADNTRYFALERRDQIPVLLVNGGPSTVATQADSFYLQRTFNPQRLEDPLIRAGVIDFSALAAVNLESYQMVAVCNPPPFDASLALKLEQYAGNGGTLVLYPGARGGVLASYALIKPLASLAIQAETFVNTRSFRFLYARHPSPLERRTKGILGRLPEFSGAQRLLIRGFDERTRGFYHFDTDTPALLNVTVGRGEIWLSALAANRAGSEWPLSPVYVVFHQLMIREGLSRRGRSLRVEVGETVELPWSGPEKSLNLALSRPDGRQQTVILERQDASQHFYLDKLHQPGLYKVELLATQPETRYIAVNTPLAESELVPLSREELAGQFAPVAIHQSESFTEQRQVLAGITSGHPLWPWLLLLAFLVGIGEELFANYRSWGQAAPEALQRILKRGGR